MGEGTARDSLGLAVPSESHCGLRGKFLATTFKKQVFAFEIGRPRGSPSLERECGGVALAVRPAEPCHHPVPSCELCPAAPAEPQLSAGQGSLLHLIPLQGDRFHARGCNKLQEHRTHRDEGGQGSFSCGFLRFLPSWRGTGRAHSHCLRSTSGSLTSPHGRRREALPRAELGSSHAPSPSAAGRARRARRDLWSPRGRRGSEGWGR